MDEFIISGPGPKVQHVVTDNGTPMGYQQLTVSTVSVALTVPTSANRAIITVETDTIRWRDDNTAPTSTVGMILFNGSTLELGTGLSLTQFKAIRDTSATVDAVLNISYYYKR